jgi:hypothetical protein
MHGAFVDPSVTIKGSLRGEDGRFVVGSGKSAVELQ